MLFGLAVASAGPLIAQQAPTRPPAPMPLRPVRFPPFVTARLASGLDLIVVEKRTQPVVTVTLAVPAGSAHDPAGKDGLASLAAALLTKGTARRTADQIAEEVEGAGGSIGAVATNDFLTITVSSLSANLAQLFELLADVVTGATFPEAEIELARTQALSGLQLQLSQPGYIAGRTFDREVYGPHPYGRAETPASLRAITREDIVRFYGERLRPTGGLLVIAGDVNPAAVRTLAATALARWTGSPPAPATEPAIPVRANAEIVLVHKPGAVQSNIVAGFPFITPRDPAAYALTVMNRILGGGADSRLFLILREQKGWTYGAYSGFSRPRGVGAFRATAEVRTEVTDSALAELVRQLERMRTEVPADSEVTAAKNYLIGRFPLEIETAEEIAGRVANARLLGLPDDYVLRYRERLQAVTRQQLQAEARRHLTTDRMVVVVVGDGQRILAGLKAQGMPVRIVDIEGRALTEADLSPAASALSLVPGRVAAGTATYRILVQGNPFGQETRTVTRVDEGGRPAWQIVTATTLGPIIQQFDTTTVDAATLQPIRVRQSGRMQGQATFVRLDYADGRVRGQARAPRGPGRIEEHTVDTAVAAGTFDDNQLAALMAALPLAAGARLSFPVFSGGQNRVATYTAAVTGEESVAVPAGTFACWKVEITGAETPVTMYVAREGAVGIVKLEITGAPIAFELTQRN
jgi:zinc protease